MSSRIFFIFPKRIMPCPHTLSVWQMFRRGIRRLSLLLPPPPVYIYIYIFRSFAVSCPVFTFPCFHRGKKKTSGGIPAILYHFCSHWSINHKAVPLPATVATYFPRSTKRTSLRTVLEETTTGSSFPYNSNLSSQLEL